MMIVAKWGSISEKIFEKGTTTTTDDEGRRTPNDKKSATGHVSLKRNANVQLSGITFPSVLEVNNFSVILGIAFLVVMVELHFSNSHFSK